MTDGQGDRNKGAGYGKPGNAALIKHVTIIWELYTTQEKIPNSVCEFYQTVSIFLLIYSAAS